MKNYRSRNKRYYTQPKNTGTVVGAIAMAVIMAASVVGGGFLGWFASEKKWFAAKSDDTETVEPADGSTETDGSKEADGSKEEKASADSLLVTPSEDSQDLAISVQALDDAVAVSNDDDDAVKVQLTVTPTPAKAQNVVIDWSIAWGDTVGSWGDGEQGEIGNYLTVTPTEDGATTAVLSCSQAFGTQAIVTASLRSNSDIKATCNVDYVQQVVGVTAGIGKTGDKTNPGFSWDFTDFSDTEGETSQTVDWIPYYTWDAISNDVFTEDDQNNYYTSTTDGSIWLDSSLNYSSIYTIKNTASKRSCIVKGTDEYYNALSLLVGYSEADGERFNTKTWSGGDVFTYYGINEETGATIGYSKELAFFGLASGFSDETYIDATQDSYDAFRTYLVEHADTAGLVIEVSWTNSKTSLHVPETQTKYITVYFENVMPATAVSFSQTQIMF